jgi:hypothetical protein
LNKKKEPKKPVCHPPIAVVDVPPALIIIICLLRLFFCCSSWNVLDASSRGRYRRSWFKVASFRY